MDFGLGGKQALVTGSTAGIGWATGRASRGIAADLSTAAACEAIIARLPELDVLVNNAGILGPSPQPALLDYPLDVLAEVYRANVLAPLGVIQALREELKPDARVINVTSDAGVTAYPGWGGYGSSKAALEQLSAVLAAENPGLKVYWVDPGDMRTDMHQAAFPGEDISDRPLPDARVPGLVAVLEGDLPSGRYVAADLGSVARTV
ncbi:MAG: SDR family oxidoreductase [Actinomycetota bacterium]